MKFKMTLFALALFAVCGCKKEESTPNCPVGFTGSDCKTEKTPLFVRLESVALKNYPSTNSGQSWDDFSSYADPYFTVEQLTGSTLIQIHKSVYQDEINPNLGTSWFVPSLRLSPGYIYQITFYDFDSNGTDSIITIKDLFNAYAAGEKFPQKITLGNVELTVSYEF